MNLLESAGFSRSNPYYIVKQGKVGKQVIAALVYTSVGGTLCLEHSLSRVHGTALFMICVICVLVNTPRFTQD